MADTKRLVADAIRICETPAPTGEEAARGRLFAEMLAEAGVPTTTDGAGNVIGEIPGDPALATFVLAAHLDTVFPEAREIRVREADGWLHAPGIGDNSMGVAALVALARELPRKGLGRIHLAATVGEEGNGDLRGARHLVETLGAGIDAFVAVEGGMRDRIVVTGIGAERLRITVTGPGGHSWGDAGTPSAIAGAAALVTDIYGIDVPTAPRSSVNVGTLSGGHSVNSIAGDARLDVDLRSMDQATVLRMRDAVTDLVRRRFADGGPLAATVETIGSRPAGAIDPGHPLVAAARAARAEAGLGPAQEIASSTDANIPLAAGLPAICVGIGIGEDAHKPAERLRVEGLGEGLTALSGLVRRAAATPAARPS
jgi:acetylornithine deacetylase/succinyl-diaminopimelate desuccinylase-like protein